MENRLKNIVMKRLATAEAVHEEWVDCLLMDQIADTENSGAKPGCKNSASCGSATCKCRMEGLRFRALRPEGLNVRPGDHVEVEVSSLCSIRAFVAVTGLPVLAGLLAWKLLADMAPTVSGGSRAGLTALAVALAATLLVLLGGKNTKKKWPEIVAVTPGKSSAGKSSAGKSSAGKSSAGTPSAGRVLS